MCKLKEQLDESYVQLRTLLACCSTESVAGWCFGPLVTAQQEQPNNRLSSPTRQISFLLALLLSTPEPKSPTALSEAGWDRAKELLNEIFSAYSQLYFPTADHHERTTAEWKRTREVSMAAFFHYFGSSLLASVAQITDRINTYLFPFDDQLKSHLGIRASEAVEICHFISKTLQSSLDRLSRLLPAEQSGSVTRFDMGTARYLPDDKSRTSDGMGSGSTERTALVEELEHLGCVSLKELEANFPGTAQTYWSEFTISRGEGPEIKYPTLPSIFDTKPLIRMDNGTAYCTDANAIFLAVLKRDEKLLLDGPLKDKYLRARDKALEHEIARYASTLFGQDATIWMNTFETPDSHYEHDVVVFDEHMCVIFEAKAPPPREPLRDPEKAFPRIRDDFREGIQMAYEQGNRLVSRLQRGETVHLFNDAGQELGHIQPAKSRFVACACVTRDDFGPLATNLTLLLKKEPRDSYPWAVNIMDLSTLAEAWEYFGWRSVELRAYLEQRLRLHGKVFASYELEFAGSFIEHGRMPEVVKADAVVQLDPNYSDVFDAIHRHIYFGAPSVQIVRKKPIFTDLRSSFSQGRPVFIDPTHSVKLGRNAPCPCNSGKKYKKCCGR